MGAQDKIGLINGALDPVSGKHAYDKWREVVPGIAAAPSDAETVGHYPQVEAPEAEVAAKALEWLPPDVNYSGGVTPWLSRKRNIVFHRCGLICSPATRCV